MEDALYMQRCLQLAKIGAGSVSPNPMVGSVLVADGRIIGEGYHRRAGEAHAEVMAIESVKAADRHLIRKSTLYVNLEPCSHYGRTPPCSKRIVVEGIPRVVIAALDPNKEVSGGGAAMLRKAGVEVVSGLLKEEALYLNRRFYTYHQKKRPRIILKWAESMDAFIAREGERNKISNAWSDRLVHRWRMEEDAILIGSNTARIDNPKLNNRLYYGKSPLRILINRDASAPSDLKLLQDDDKLLILNEIKSSKKNKKEWIKVNFSEGIIPVLKMAGTQHEILSVLVEGGAFTLNHFIENGHFDELRIIRNNALLLGSGVRAPDWSQQGLKMKEHYFIGDDEIMILEHAG